MKSLFQSSDQRGQYGRDHLLDLKEHCPTIRRLEWRWMLWSLNLNLRRQHRHD